MATHNRGYYRKMRIKHIARKKRIIHELNDYWHYSYDGTLSKGKIHCSCPMCRAKDIHGRHIKTLQEQKFEDKFKEQIQDI